VVKLKSCNVLWSISYPSMNRFWQETRFFRKNYWKKWKIEKNLFQFKDWDSATFTIRYYITLPWFTSTRFEYFICHLNAYFCIFCDTCVCVSISHRRLPQWARSCLLLLISDMTREWIALEQLCPTPNSLLRQNACRYLGQGRTLKDILMRAGHWMAYFEFSKLKLA